MANTTANTIPESSPDKITIELVYWSYDADSGDNVDSFDVTHWTPDQIRDLRQYLQSHGATLLQSCVVR